MKFPLIEKLKTWRGTERKVVPAPRLTVTRDYEPIGPPVFPAQIHMRSECTWAIDQYVVDDKGAVQLADERAKQAIARSIYGPVEDELRRILEICWETGAPSEVEKEIRKLSQAMRLD